MPVNEYLLLFLTKHNILSVSGLLRLLALAVILCELSQDKKAAQEKERETRIAEAEEENLLGSRHQEGLKLRQKLAEKQLQIKEMSSDGHCLYRAVEDQLIERGRTLGIKELRAETAQYMRSHADDFLPFLTNPNTGDMYTAGEPQQLS